MICLWFWLWLLDASRHRDKRWAYLWKEER